MSDTLSRPAGEAPMGDVVDLDKHRTAPAVPAQPALPDDPDGDRPFIAPWLRTSDGRKAARSRAGRRAKRSARRWMTRQRTSRGHAAQITRGGRRVHEWVIGHEGIQVQATRHNAHAATREARDAARRARYTIGKQRQAAQQYADRAQTAALSASKTHKDARAQVRRGRIVRGSAAYLGPVVVDVFAWMETGWLGAIGGTAAILGGAAILGRRQLTGESWDPERRSLGDGDPLSETMLDRAFVAAKVITEGQQLRLLSPVAVDGDDAWTVLLDLPDGVTVDKARAREVELAAALGIDRAQLDMRQAGGESRLTLWASMRDPFARTVRSPLLDRREPLNTWRDGIPLAFDKRGSIVAVTISDYSLLFGGATRSGKGMGIANVLAGALLDPRVRVRLFDGKGTGEYVPHAPVLHTFVRRNPRRLRDFLKVEVEEMNRRTDVLVELGLSKLSEDLIDKVGGIELVIVDELATYTAPEGPSKEYAEEITEYLAQLAAVGAAVGIIVVLATQFPEVAIVPSRLRGNCSGRMAMRTENADASNTILGKGAAGNGYDSSKIQNAKTTRGRAWLTTPDTGMIAVRSLFIDESTGESKTLIAIGAELRRAAGTLPGHCPDPVEAEMLLITGASSAAGGVSGNGGIVRGTVIDHLVRAAEGTGRGCVTTAEAFAALAKVDVDRYGRAEGETDAAYASRAGKALKAQLEALEIEVPSAKVPAADGSRTGGYTLTALKVAESNDRKVR